MRVNQFIARASGLSRRAADTSVEDGRVQINARVAVLGDQVGDGDAVMLDNKILAMQSARAIAFHKPVGFVTSRRQQGSTPTIYSLLPPELNDLKPVGRLDRDTSGLLLLTNDGVLAQSLQHPSQGKRKQYHVWLDRKLSSKDLQTIGSGISLSDGISHMEVAIAGDHYVVTLEEGRNRQIRRSFGAIKRRITKLHRTDFGAYKLGDLAVGEWRDLATTEANQ